MSGNLAVRVIAAKNLIAADKGGTSDPYCKLRVGTTTAKTRVIKKCLNPKWEETFRFKVANPKTTKLVIECMDKDTWTKDDPLGSLAIPLTTLEKGVEHVAWYNLTGVQSGQINIGLTAVDFGLPPGSLQQQQQATNNAFQSNYGSNLGENSPQRAAAYPSQGYPSAQPGAQPGYPSAQGGYPAAQASYNSAGGYPSAQPGGYPAAQPGGYSAQPGGYPAAQPQQGYNAQPGGYPAQPGGYPAAQPQQGYNAQPGGYPAAQPQQGGYPSAQQTQQNQGNNPNVPAYVSGLF